MMPDPTTAAMFERFGQIVRLQTLVEVGIHRLRILNEDMDQLTQRIKKTADEEWRRDREHKQERRHKKHARLLTAAKTQFQETMRHHDKLGRLLLDFYMPQEIVDTHHSE